MIKIRLLNKKNTHYHLACSGGIDSVAAAVLLKKLNYDFSIIHFNHQFQPINSDMETMTRELAKKLKVEFYHGVRGDGAGLCKGESVEAQLREARLKFFMHYRNPIILCHHLDDCVESYFMNILRGHEGFVPIPPITLLENNNLLMRPFMENRKEEFISFIERNRDFKEFVVEDPTNNDTKYRRNFIRHDLIPLIPKEMGIHTVVKKKVSDAYEKLSAK